MDWPSAQASSPFLLDGEVAADGATVLHPGEFHLLTHGDLNTPRWLKTFEEISLVLDRRFVANVVREGLPADRVEFATQRSRCDPTIARYAEAFRSELVADCPHGLLYTDALAVGFALHLLSNYAIARPKLRDREAS